MSLLADQIIRQAIRRPYSKGHLCHPDGSLYMGRYAFVETEQLAVRVHYLATADQDRHLHDHPWPFISVVLSGGYIEARAVDRNPCFAGDRERIRWVDRRAGSIAFRRATDRHAITHVEPDTWTLVITGPQVQWWGFYTTAGKVWWKDYGRWLLENRYRASARAGEAHEILEHGLRVGIPGELRSFIEKRLETYR